MLQAEPEITAFAFRRIKFNPSNQCGENETRKFVVDPDGLVIVNGTDVAAPEESKFTISKKVKPSREP